MHRFMSYRRFCLSVLLRAYADPAPTHRSAKHQSNEKPKAVSTVVLGIDKRCCRAPYRDEQQHGRTTCDGFRRLRAGQTRRLKQARGSLGRRARPEWHKESGSVKEGIGPSIRMKEVDGGECAFARRASMKPGSAAPSALHAL